MKFRNIFLIIILSFMIGCATIQMEVKDPTGRLIPTPHYYSQAIGYPIAVLFYYTVYEEVEDLDGTILQKPTYLSLFDTHDINTSQYKIMTLTIEIDNPEKIEYSLYKEEDIIIGEGEDRIVVNVGGQFLNSSNSQYRQFVYTLPYGDNLHKVDHTVIMQIDDNEVVRAGTFSYTLNQHRKGGFNTEK